MKFSNPFMAFSSLEVATEALIKELQAKVRTVSGSSQIYGQVNLNDSGVEWENDPQRYIRGEFSSSSGDIRVL